MNTNAPAASKAHGKLGILTPGLGAVSTTFIAGVLAVRAGTGVPVGSVSQLGDLALADGTVASINDVVPLAGLDDRCLVQVHRR